MRCGLKLQEEENVFLGWGKIRVHRMSQTMWVGSSPRKAQAEWTPHYFVTTYNLGIVHVWSGYSGIDLHNRLSGGADDPVNP